MPKPTPQQVLARAQKLKNQRFALRDTDLQQREDVRFMRDVIEVPAAYAKTTQKYHTPMLDEEGRQLASLIMAKPVPHLVPPTPAAQEATSTCENWLMAAFEQLEADNGQIWWQSSLGQAHAKLGVIYLGAKRKPYEGGPTAPKDDDDISASIDYLDAYTAHKKEQGISGAFDYRYVPTNTFYYRGNVLNPLEVFEIKEIDEDEVMLMYGLERDRDGRFSWPKEATTLPSGESQAYGTDTTRQVRVVEYWNREYCLIVLETIIQGSAAMSYGREPFVLDEWKHNWGRVPYFAAPAFENEVMAEEHKFGSPLDPIYVEAPAYNRNRTIMSNVSYNTGFAAFKIVTKETGDQILDDSGQTKRFIEFQPGKAFQLAPGQDLLPVQQAPEVAILQAEVLSSEQRIKQFSISDVSRGVSPGADTANSAISQLRRAQRSYLDPMSQAQSRQAREMFRFMLLRILDESGEGVGETVFVYNDASGDMIGLGPQDIPTTNLQVVVQHDRGVDGLVEEKQAAELAQLGLITELEFHERRGKENPDDFVKANFLERLRRTQEATLQQQVLAALGDTQAIAQLIAASQQTGDAKDAIPSIMQQVSQMQGHDATGIGTGSPDQPRAMGVRSPAVQTTTQREAAGIM